MICYPDSPNKEATTEIGMQKHFFTYFWQAKNTAEKRNRSRRVDGMCAVFSVRIFFCVCTEFLIFSTVADCVTLYRVNSPKNAGLLHSFIFNLMSFANQSTHTNTRFQTEGNIRRERTSEKHRRHWVMPNSK